MNKKYIEIVKIEPMIPNLCFVIVTDMIRVDGKI